MTFQIKKVIKNPSQTNKTADGKMKIKGKLEDSKVLEIILASLNNSPLRQFSTLYILF